MKRAVVRAKIKPAGQGVKPKARRRAATSPTTATKKRAAQRRPAKPKTVAKKKKMIARVGAVKTRRPAVRHKVAARRPRLKIPALLLAGDEPEVAPPSGPGEKFALGPETPAAHFAAEAALLPAAYGTGRLFLTARDPHWLHAHWDLTPTEQFRHNAKSEDRHLILRLHAGAATGKTVSEIHVHPESRYWFTHVERAGEKYVAELGYYQTGHKWKSLATSGVAATPPGTVSSDSTVEFATIPLELHFETMLALLQEGGAAPSPAAPGSAFPLARAIEKARAAGHLLFHKAEAGASPAAWTPEQAAALAEFIATSQPGRVAAGSPEAGGPPGGPAGLAGPGGQGDLDFGNRAGEFGSPDFGGLSFPGESSPSSPFGGGPEAPPGFWFSVNAELVVYGATEPNATVTIGGKPIALQPDGSFRYRFTLPDGAYELPIVAVAADGTDARAAELKFSRATEIRGDVGVSPQDPSLNPPTPGSV
jgi:hypothetical protein